MPLTLHEAVVPNWLQMLGAARRLLDKAEAWAEENGIAEADLLDSRLAGDMLPLAYQFKSCWEHSANAVERCREGQFSPSMQPPPMTYAGLRAGLEEAVTRLETLEADELEDLAGKDMTFVMGDMRMDFTVQDFLLSFSTPNAFFHAATAYGILRMKGMPLGKRDFMGRVRVRQG